MEKTKINIASKTEDYSQWYLDVAKAWELFEYSPVPWCIVFKPKAVNLWEKMKKEMNDKLSFLWVQNVYLPLLIPMSFFEKEKEHVEWFAPELAVVTHGWWKDLEDNLAIRPTSETMFCEYFRWELQSYRDLPILTNQWVNVFRWEKRTRPFLRTSEFYWQEGHTLHETQEEAREFAIDIMANVYVTCLRDYMAIAWIQWRKTESEKFAWADETYTYEPMMSNWWALQICTSHLLWKWFMEQFDVSFLNREWKQDHPFYTSWGLSTRSIWWLISSHSDQKWLIIPPKMSEYKAVILPIYWKDNKQAIDDFVVNIGTEIVWHIWVNLSGEYVWAPVKWTSFRSLIWDNQDKVLIDYRDARFWEKIADFELSGYPVAIVIWQKELEEKIVTVISRITWEKVQVSNTEVANQVEKFLKEWQEILLENSKKRLQENIVHCRTIDEIWEAVWNSKFAVYEWDVSDNIKDSKLEAEIKEKFKATTRCIPVQWQFEVIDNFKLLKNNTIKVIIARAF